VRIGLVSREVTKKKPPTPPIRVRKPRVNRISPPTFPSKVTIPSREFPSHSLGLISAWIPVGTPVGDGSATVRWETDPPSFLNSHRTRLSLAEPLPRQKLVSLRASFPQTRRRCARLIISSCAAAVTRRRFVSKAYQRCQHPRQRRADANRENGRRKLPGQRLLLAAVTGCGRPAVENVLQSAAQPREFEFVAGCE